MNPIRQRTRARSIPVTLLLALLLGPRPGGAAELELRRGDHIAIVGNTLAERMQHDGWLETVLQARFPGHELSFRNLGFSADEVAFRQRSQNFGSPDDYLTAHEADVVLAFFGFNESFAGREGLDRFRSDLETFIKETLAKRYNGESAPRLVLFSPIAHEDLGTPALPDGRADNERLELYTDAMAAVAKANGATFVDVFRPTRKLFAELDEPLTINGIHLTAEGNRRLAVIIGEALFGAADEPVAPSRLERLRAAVVDKDFYWFQRYRTTDGYNVFGGRSSLKYTDDISNWDVLQREMHILDAMAANRDRRIWAVARGGDFVVDDNDTPEFIAVKTNKPGPGPAGAHIYLGGEEAIEKMTVHDGMKVELVATEERFPELVNPVQMAFDTRGRLWVAAWPTYPHWKPKDPMNDKLLILEDDDGDGKTDRTKVFAGDLHNPTGFEFWGGGVIVAMVPDLLFLQDLDGDDRPDVRRRILHGLGSEDTHHSANSFVIDAGGALYFQEGTFHRTQIETPYGPVRNRDGCVWRFEPRTWKVDRFVAFNFANPHGHVVDTWGQNFVHDGTGAVPYHAALFSGHLEFPDKHGGPPTLYDRRTRPCPGTTFLTSRHFPDELQGNMLVANVIGDLAILQYRIEENASSFEGTEIQPIVKSTDSNFRPSDLEIGPDGALYFTDWQNAIIGHMQHHLRDPSRDHAHGRVYRVTYPSRPLLKPAAVDGAEVSALVDLLVSSAEDRERYRARLELSERPTAEVIDAARRRTRTLLAQRDAGPRRELRLLEMLWLHQNHDVVDAPLLGALLESSDHRARAAAVRVLCYWRDRVPNALELLKKRAADPHGLVRLEAVRAASFFKEPGAVEVPIISMDQPTDPYMEYTRGETMRTLDPIWRGAVARGEPIPMTSDAGRRFFLGHMSVDELLKVERSRPVYLELLFRGGVREEFRREALAGLAKLEEKSELRVLLDALAELDADPERDASAVFDLVRLLAGRPESELAGIRGELERLATSARLPVMRQIGYVSLILADRDVEGAWTLGSRGVAGLRDLVSAMPLVPDASLRADLYPHVEPLLHGLPANLSRGGNTARGAYGRYVRVELDGRRRTLTLAEVEVYSDGRNVARGGRASQKNTAHGGDAARALDGNTSASYGDGGQTHTSENTRDPWWEVDLGEEYPIDSIVVFNRADGPLGRRLQNYTLRVLDGDRNEVWGQERQPAPEPRASFELGGGGPESVIRRAAMEAVTHVRGKEDATFRTLAKFVREDVERAAAIRALQRLPRELWPQDEAKPLVESVLAWIRTVPAAERTSPAALDALQLGESLAALLPVEEARRVRAELGDLGVRVVRLGTRPHQMLFDKDRIVVEAGKQVEIIFENTDIMPHNFALTKPGALVEVGTLAEESATQPGALERGYVPASDKIILSSRLLQPRESQTLSFTAPAAVGVYPYVCTYPGHWRRMFGAMYVVDDIQAYLADAEGYLAANPIPIADPMLEVRRPRTEWTFAELVEDIKTMPHGRSYGNGQQLFEEVASCVSCHKLNDKGTELGPNLAELDPARPPEEILRDVLEPSWRINEKYFSYLVVTKQGQALTGLVTEDTPKSIKLVQNPLVTADATEILKSDILQQQKSETSIMPEGLLSTLTREEILDLIAFVVARGKRDHEIFNEGCGHGSE